jgi:hypothetical protein
VEELLGGSYAAADRGGRRGAGVTTQKSHSRVAEWSTLGGGGLLLQMSRWARVGAIWLRTCSKAAKAIVVEAAFEIYTQRRSGDVLFVSDV